MKYIWQEKPWEIWISEVNDILSWPTRITGGFHALTVRFGGKAHIYILWAEGKVGYFGLGISGKSHNTLMWAKLCFETLVWFEIRRFNLDSKESMTNDANSMTIKGSMTNYANSMTMKMWYDKKSSIKLSSFHIDRHKSIRFLEEESWEGYSKRNRSKENSVQLQCVMEKKR